MQHEPTQQVGHERADVALRPIVAFAIALVVLCAAAGFGLQWLFDAFARGARSRDEPAHPLALEVELAPSPRLQANPSAELARFRESERKLAESYAWIDRDGGVVRIPVERALELVLERGLPARKEPRR